jgi:uncharacterized protein (DUF58 family)
LTVIAAVVASALMAAGFGTRTLDVVYITGGALLVATAAGVARGERPAATRRAPEYGAVDGAVTVELTVDAGRPVSASVRDATGEGLDADARFETVADGRSLEYELVPRERGVHRLGPLTVSVGDAFGLWRRTFEYDDTDRFVAYPPIQPLYGSAGPLSAYVGVTDDRGQFDGIRGYERGDALRDVNWKASAKRPDELVVTEYTGEGAKGALTVAVEAGAAERADDAAEAAASLAVHLLDAGLSVGLRTPQAEIPPGTGEHHRREVFGALARFEAGTLSAADRGDADATVRALAGGDVTVAFGSEVHRFRELAGLAEGAEPTAGDGPEAAADGGVGR